MKKIILASSSPYRRELLHRLGLPFDSISPDIDETALENEGPAALVSRLAFQKVQAIAQDHPDAIIIGSDQVATINNEILTNQETLITPLCNYQLALATR